MPRLYAITSDPERSTSDPRAIREDASMGGRTRYDVSLVNVRSTGEVRPNSVLYAR